MQLSSKYTSVQVRRAFAYIQSFGEMVWNQTGDGSDGYRQKTTSRAEQHEATKPPVSSIDYHQTAETEQANFISL